MATIVLNSVAFRNHMRAKTQALKPWCLFLADDFAVFEFGARKGEPNGLTEAYESLIQTNEYYGYGIHSDGVSRIAVTNPDRGK